MDRIDKRRYPRSPVNLAAVVAPSVPVMAVIDLSEGGAGLEWNMSGDIVVGETVRLRFMLAEEQSIEIEGRITRITNGRAGIEFLGTQQRLVRQLLAEARSAD